MINGKFFSGLPPRMMDRGGNAQQNRLESHIFWPDESQIDSAVECKLKRRNSMLNDTDGSRSRSRLHQQQKSEQSEQSESQNKWDNHLKANVDHDDIDTKQRFHREFAKSSIQFYDNLNDQKSHPNNSDFDGDNYNNRRTLLRNPKSLDITAKPNATKMVLPDSIIDEKYTAAKKQQQYESKIAFYDYDTTDNQMWDQQKNNMRKPKLDKNDKRDVELNTKNSPKLQMKHTMKHCLIEPPLTDSKKIVNNSKLLEQPSQQKEDNLKISLNNLQPENIPDDIDMKRNVKERTLELVVRQPKRPSSIIYKNQKDFDRRRYTERQHSPITYDHYDDFYDDYNERGLEQRDRRRLLRNTNDYREYRNNHIDDGGYDDGEIEERFNDMNLYNNSLRPKRISPPYPRMRDDTWANEGNDYVMFMMPTTRYNLRTNNFRHSQPNLINAYLSSQQPSRQPTNQSVPMPMAIQMSMPMSMTMPMPMPLSMPFQVSPAYYHNYYRYASPFNKQSFKYNYDTLPTLPYKEKHELKRGVSKWPLTNNSYNAIHTNNNNNNTNNNNSNNNNNNNNNTFRLHKGKNFISIEADKRSNNLLTSPTVTDIATTTATVTATATQLNSPALLPLTTNTTQQPTAAATTTTKNPRHLRSSLYFHDGAVIADNNVDLQPIPAKRT